MTTELPVDPSLVEEAAALDIEAAAARHAGLVEQVERANRLYHVEDAPEISDAEYDQLFRRAGRARERLSAARHPGFADPARRRHPDRHDVRRGPSPAADAVAGERVQPRRAACVRHARAPRSRPAARSRARRRAALCRRAQDRRPRDHAALRARPLRPGRHARRRDDRRGRDGQPAHDQGRPAAALGHCIDGRPRRGLHAEGRVRADQQRARGGRAAAVREPAEQWRGLAPPEGPPGDGEPAAVGMDLPADRGRRGRRRRCCRRRLGRGWGVDAVRGP